MREEILRWLTMLLWASTDELAAAVERTRPTALRHLGALFKAGLVGYREVGLSPTVLRRWLPTSDGLYVVYPERHGHPGAEDHHVHDPQRRFQPHIYLHYSEDHAHPTFFHSRLGAADLFVKRLHLFPFIYPLAVKLFTSEEVRWHRDRIKAKLISFRWLRRGRLVAAVGEYEGGITIFFCWVPRQLTRGMIEDRLDRRFTGLYGHPEWLRPNPGVLSTGPVPRPDPDDAPRPSGYAYICEDRGALELVMRIIDERVNRGVGDHATLLICPSNPDLRFRKGRVQPTFHNLWDLHSDVTLGEPEQLLTTFNEERDHDG